MENLGRLGWWKGKHVFVTGATGVVGLNLVNRLVSYKAKVIVLVRDSVPQAQVLGPWLEGQNDVILVRGELENFNLIMRSLGEYEIQYVFHLGAQTIVGVGNRSPLTTFKANIEGTWNLLEAVRILNSYSQDIKAVCIASSDKAYGTSPKLPYHEEMPLHGEHPYDVSKSCADLIAQSYGKTYDLPISIARMGNIYGPGDVNYNRIIPGTIRSLLKGNDPEIRSDGTPIREYFFVEDAVDAYLTLAESTNKLSLHGEPFNFSSGERYSVLDLVNIIIKMIDPDRNPVFINTCRHEIQDQYLSIEKAERVLKWHPQISLYEGLEKTIEWYKRVLI